MVWPPPIVWLTSVLVCLASVALTGAVTRHAIARGRLDVPNSRSSHKQATPRGGGLAIALTTLLTFGAFALCGWLRPTVGAALIGGGSAVALVGYLDDRRPLPAAVRLAVHVAAAVWAVAWLGGLPGWHFPGAVVCVVGIAWVLNLFNFMDGIDGIAASEAVFVAWGAALIMGLLGVSHDLIAACVILGAACLGFLAWNWPPARVFMGDVGSGYLGYVVAVLALGAAHDRMTALWEWLILGAAFFIDASVTLVRRVWCGERAHEAHRSHAYQHLARRWNSHRRTTLAVLAVNLLWLLPCAVIAAQVPEYALALVVVALLPLAVIAVIAGAGRSEAGAQQDL